MSLYADLSKRLYDYSLLNDFEKCERRGYWGAVRNVLSSAPSPAMHFGSAVHMGIDAWRQSSKQDDAALAAYGDAMAGMPDDARRTFEHGRRLLQGYFTRYREEPFKVLAGEVCFKVPMPDGSFLAGRIDGVVEWGEYIYVLETKTTSSLGAGFMQGFKPNLQIDIYSYAVKRAFGRCGGALVDAISTAKLKGGTDEGYLRDITDRTPEDLAAFERYYRHAVGRLEGRLHDYRFAQETDPATAEPIAREAFEQRFAACFYYGACPYVKLCLYRAEPDESEFRTRQPLEVVDELTGVAAAYNGGLAADRLSRGESRRGAASGAEAPDNAGGEHA